MKKNLFLLVVLFSLIGIAWLLEGKNSLLVTDTEKTNPVLNVILGDLLEIHLPNARIVRGESGFVVSNLNYPANPEMVKKLVEKLNSISVIRELKVPKDKTSEYFLHQSQSVSVKSETGEYILRLGDVSEVTGNFFVESLLPGERKLFVAKDTSFFEGVYRNELEANLRRYLDLKDLLVSGPFDLVDRRLLGVVDSAALSEARFEGRLSRWFELDFSKGTTKPLPPKGIHSVVSPVEFSQALGKINFSRFHKAKGNTLLNPLSSLELGLGKEKITLELFGQMSGEKGYFVKKSDDENRIFRIDDESRSIFFLTAQDFWLKRPNLRGADLARMNELEFSLGASIEDLRKFKVKDFESFQVFPEGNNVTVSDQSYFNLVFNTLFSGNGFEQAKYVNPLGPAELQKKLKRCKEKVFISIFGKNFAMGLLEEELYLWDLEDKVELVYPAPVGIEKLGQRQFFAFKKNRG